MNAFLRYILCCCYEQEEEDYNNEDINMYSQLFFAERKEQGINHAKVGFTQLYIVDIKDSHI